jgi:hypothetical protein
LGEGGFPRGLLGVTFGYGVAQRFLFCMPADSCSDEIVLQIVECTQCQLRGGRLPVPGSPFAGRADERGRWQGLQSLDVQDAFPMRWAA